MKRTVTKHIAKPGDKIVTSKQAKPKVKVEVKGKATTKKGPAESGNKKVEPTSGKLDG